ncbi:MAG TPA: hypothetical protein VFR41_00415 [Acidimicrobiia bacterium]|nr:hypothetical protein [Acidimicrobiia bacterium]
MLQTTDRANPASLPDHADAPRHERAARHEIDRLRVEIEELVGEPANDHARNAVDAALHAMARLQVVTANLDACRPPAAKYYGSSLVALADLHLNGAADAIERGMTYTADNQMRLLKGQPTR